MSTRGLIISFAEKPAELWPHAKHVEVSTRDKLCIDLFRVTRGPVDLDGAVNTIGDALDGGDSIEDLTLLLCLEEEWVREEAPA